MATYRDMSEAFDRFANDWDSGRQPRLETYLNSFDEASRPQLLFSLLPVELDHVRRNGGTPSEAAYLKRFPQFANVIHQVFSSQAASTQASAATVAYEVAPKGQQPARISHFEIISLLGEGAFGRVYRARDTELERDVAIKVPRLQDGDASFDVQHFLREAKAAATIRHPNICPVYEAGIHDGKPYIVMAYIPGKSLAEVLKNRPPPPPRQVALIVRKLALALQAAHEKGVIHRDLKPSNILFDQNRKDVVVTDFGLARRNDLDDAGQTRSGIIMGTPAYMAPEQARGESRTVGPAADIYALGAVLFELLAGMTPFTGSAREVIDMVQDLDPLPPSARRDGVDPHLEEICMKALARNPGDRFPSMRAFADAIQEYQRRNPRDAAGRSATSAQDSTGFADLIANALAEQKAEMAAAVEAAVSKARTPLWKILLPMGLLAVFGLVMLGMYLFSKPATVAVTLQLDVNLKDNELTFILDDKPIEAEKLAGPIEMTVGKHVLIVKHGETIIRRYEFEVKKGMDPYLKLVDSLAPPWPMTSVPPASVHYPLDGTGSAMLNDTRRRASVGQINGTVESAKGIIGQAAGLSGTGSLEIHDNPVLHYSSKLTVAAWIIGSSENSTIVSRTTSAGSSFQLGTDTAKKLEPVEIVTDRSLTRVITWTVHFAQGTKDDEAVTVRATYDPLHWTHVAATFDGHFLRIYLNGYLAAEKMLADDPTFRKLMDDGRAKLPANIASSKANLVMGDKFNGQLDDVMLFDSALAEKELREIIHFHAPRQLATPPAQPVNFASEPTDLTYARLQGKLGENINLAPIGMSDSLQVEKQAEITFPIAARNYVVRGTLTRLEKEGGLLRIRQSNGNAYACYFNSDGRIGLIKESNGKVTDLTSKQFKFEQMTATRMKTETVQEQVTTNDGQKKMVNVCKCVPIQISTIQPVFFSLAVHNEQLTLFINGQPYLEHKGEGITEGAIAMNVIKDGILEFSSLQVVTIDGTGWTPQQVSYLGYSYKSSIKPEFVDVWKLEEPLNTINLQRMVKEQIQAPYTVTVTKKETRQQTRKVQKSVDGKTVEVEEPFTVVVDVPTTETRYATKEVHKLVPEALSLLTTRITDTLGNPLKMPELLNRLTRGDACLTLASDKLYPAVKYLDKTKPETVLVLIPPPAVQPATAPPAPAASNAIPPAPVAATPAMPAPAKPVEPKRRLSQLTGHANPIQTVVYSPDGSQIATADGTFWKPGFQPPEPEITNISTGNALHKLSGKTYLGTGMFSADGSLLAGTSQMNVFKLFDAATGKEKLSNSESKSQIYELALSADGKWIATGGGVYNQQPNAPAPANSPPRGEVNIWNAATGKLHINIKGHEVLVTRVAFNPKGSQLATIDQAGTVRICDANKGSILFTIPVEQGNYASSVAFGEKYLALGLSSSNKAFIRLIHADTGKKHTDIALPAPEKETPGYSIEKLVFTADGTRLVAKDTTPRLVDGTSPSDNIWIFDLASGKQLHKLETALKGFMAASPDGNHFGVSSQFDPKPKLKVWETATGKLLQTLEGQLYLVALKQGGQEALILKSVEVKEDHPPLAIKLWNASDGSLIRSHDIPGSGIASIAYSSDGKRLAAGICSIDKTKPQYFVGELHVWDTATGKELQNIKGIDGWIMQVGIDAQGNKAITTTGMESTVWDVNTGKKLHTLPGGMRMTMDPSGKTIVVAGGFGPPAEEGKPKPKSIRIYNLEDGKEQPGLDLPQNVNAMTMARNGLLLTASPDGIRTWNLQNSIELRKHPANVGHLALVKGDTLLLTATSRSTFTLRNSSSGAAQKRLRLKPKAPENAPPQEQMFAMGFAYDARGVPMALSPDGQTLAVVSLDGKTVHFKPVSELEDATSEDIAPEEKTSSHHAAPVVAMPVTPAPSKTAEPAPQKTTSKPPAEPVIPAGWNKLTLLEMIDHGKLSVEINDRSVNLPPISLFDGDVQTLLRSNAINPIKLKLNFSSPIDLRGIRLMTSGKHEWTVTTKPGGPSPKVASPNAQWSSYELPKPASTTEIHLEIHRTGSDNFVLIKEIELYTGK